MRESFEPHRAAWHALAILIGSSALVVPPHGLAAIVPGWLLGWWAFNLAGSGVLGIIAPVGQARSVITALALERAALWVQTGTLAWIIVSALYLRGMADGFGLAAYLVWITANVIRERRIASAVTKSEVRPGE
jgi:hypothetical protein